MKKCTKCLVEKELSEFSLKRDKPNSRCKSCVGTYMQEHYMKNQDREKAKRKAYYESNRDVWIARSRKNYETNKKEIKFQRLFRAYGITKEAYMEKVKEQKHACAICKKSNGKALAVDHCHETGIVRGLLCDPCNTALGLLKESPESMQSALAYLAKYQK